MYPKDPRTILKAIREKSAPLTCLRSRRTYNREVEHRQGRGCGVKADSVVICSENGPMPEKRPANIADLALPDAQLHLALKIMKRKSPSFWCSRGPPAHHCRIADPAQAIVMVQPQQ